MNKCEWRDDRFIFCDGSNGIFDEVGACCIEGAIFCPYCGSDIRKQEPEVIIKQSGGTWVARCDGIDYIDTDPQAEIPRFDLNLLSNKHKWKPFSEIELTDEIAKLRPMVWVANDSENDMLYGINGATAILLNTGRLATKFIRLATVDDLP